MLFSRWFGSAEPQISAPSLQWLRCWVETQEGLWVPILHKTRQQHFQRELHLHVFLNTVWFVRLGDDNDVSLDQKADQDLGNNNEEHEHWDTKKYIQTHFADSLFPFNLQFVLLHPYSVFGWLLVCTQEFDMPGFAHVFASRLAN